MKISIIIPVYNEEKTIKKLTNQIINVFNKSAIKSFEIIFIDDGSNDNSWEEISLLSKYKFIKAYQLRKNYGKATALMLGFKKAEGDIVITIDGDLQDDPIEIPKFINKINNGFDLVSGWKVKRHDPISKTFPSKVFNKLLSISFKTTLHDMNCGYKAYTKEAVASINIYGELHRFIPILLANKGFKITEIRVIHHSRKYGKSKYGFSRFLKGFIDLLTVLFTTKYLNRPGHLFGTMAFIFGIIGSSSLFYLFIQWLIGNRPIGDRPLLLFGILMMMLSTQLLSTGLLAELINRNTRKLKLDSLISKEIN
jgi:glycosyltransferase involved in cell wall biosynthesis